MRAYLCVQSPLQKIIIHGGKFCVHVTCLRAWCAWAHADIQLFIPMRGMIQSLNLSVATSVCLNEICRQRSIADNPEEYAMQPDEQKNIVRQLSMKRRGFRQGGMTDAKNERLKRTWATMVRKSLKVRSVSPLQPLILSPVIMHALALQSRTRLHGQKSLLYEFFCF